MARFFKCLCWLVLVCSSGQAFGQRSLVTDSASVKKEKRLTIVALPALFYTPETKFGYGIALSPVFRLGNDTITRSSNIQFKAIRTMRKQTMLLSSYTLFTPGEKFLISGDMDFYDYPILYYGVGPRTDSSNKEEISYNLVNFQTRVLRQVKKSLFAGLQFRYVNQYDIKYTPESLLLIRPEQERSGGVSSGLGYSFVFDNRDKALNASKGAYLELSSFYHHKIFGSDYKFSRYTADARKYYAFNEKQVLAGQVLGTFNTGEVNFQEMAQLGGQYLMRGYFKGRFRDKQLLASQVEFRQHLFWRIGMVAFASAGNVTDKIGNLELNDMKYAAGGGLRILISEKEKLNIRIDVGRGRESTEFYFGIAEAF